MAMDTARLAEVTRLNDPNGSREVPASDAAGVMAMLRGLRARSR